MFLLSLILLVREHRHPHNNGNLGIRILRVVFFPKHPKHPLTQASWSP